MRTIVSLLLLLGFCVRVEGRAGSRYSGQELFSRSSHVALIRYTSVEIRRVQNLGQTYLYRFEEQVAFKGRPLSNSVEVVAWDESLFPDAIKVEPERPRCAILFLSRSSDSRFRFTAGDIRQVFLEPDIAVKVSAFKSFEDLLLYLLESRSASNRKVGLLIAGGIAAQRVREGLLRIAESSIGEEATLAREALVEHGRGNAGGSSLP